MKHFSLVKGLISSEEVRSLDFFPEKDKLVLEDISGINGMDESVKEELERNIAAINEEIQNISAELFETGVDYITPISENIIAQMRKQMAEDENKSFEIDNEVLKDIRK